MSLIGTGTAPMAEALEKIESLQRELAQHKAVIAEQKETIDEWRDDKRCGFDRVFEAMQDAPNDPYDRKWSTICLFIRQQSALIEKLGTALKWSWQNLYSLADPAKVIETEEALAAYEEYRK